MGIFLKTPQQKVVKNFISGFIPGSSPGATIYNSVTLSGSRTVSLSLSVMYRQQFVSRLV